MLPPHRESSSCLATSAGRDDDDDDDNDDDDDDEDDDGDDDDDDDDDVHLHLPHPLHLLLGVTHRPHCNIQISTLCNSTEDQLSNWKRPKYQKGPCQNSATKRANFG